MEGKGHWIFNMELEKSEKKQKKKNIKKNIKEM